MKELGLDSDGGLIRFGEAGRAGTAVVILLASLPPVEAENEEGATPTNKQAMDSIGDDA